MLKKFFQTENPVPQQLYGAVVTQSRKPIFFSKFGFEDTPMGRFDALSMHLFLFSRRLVREDTSLSTSLNQEVFDCYTADLDTALRALGVGDPTVPKRKKKMVRSFYGQIEDFAKSMDDADQASLELAVKKRYFEKVEKDRANEVANYMLQTSSLLDNQKMEQILKGKLNWLEDKIVEALV